MTKAIERLLGYAKEKEIMVLEDEIFIRNGLLDLFNLNEPYEGELGREALTPREVLDPLLDYSYEIGLIPENITTYRDLLESRIMGIVMPRPSQVTNKFNNIAESKGIKAATDNFYKLAKDSNYIHTDRIAKNLYWKSSTDYGDMEITINLSKPEKDAKEIEKAKSMKQSNYPKCLLCAENVGFSGNLNHPGRQNHRIIPLDLAGQDWNLQYSPYVYYNEHCIVLSQNHIPMTMTKETFKRLLSFIEQFPHYFLGANAGLPVVGGSIMSHEHYQGGRHEFAMDKAPIQYKLEHKDYPNVDMGILNWPLSVIRLSSKDKDSIIDLAGHILERWEKYSDDSVGVLASTKEDGEKVKHNTITPIARKNDNDEYVLNLALRNNRRSEKYPDGIFHPHPHLHHIKKENIGVIEVMGLAVLPGRLSTELTKTIDILDNETINIDEDSDLKKHEKWINEIRSKHGTDMSKGQAKKIVKYEVGNKFAQVLEDAGVFKCDDKGREAFLKFMDFADCRQQ